MRLYKYMPTSIKFSVNKFNQKGAIHFLIPLLLLAGIIGGVYLVTSGNPLKLFTKAANPPIVFKSSSGGNLPANSAGIPQTDTSNIKIELTSTLGPPVFASPLSSPAPTIIPPANGAVSCNSDNMASFTWTAGSFPGKTVSNYTLRINKSPADWAPDASTPATSAVEGDRAIQTGNVTSIQVALTEGIYLDWTIQPGFSDGTVGETYDAGNEFRCSSTVQTLGVDSQNAVPANQTAGTVSYKIAENPADLDRAASMAYTKDPMVLDYTFADSTPGQKFIWVEFQNVAGTTDRRSAQIDLVSPSPTAAPSSTPKPTSQPRPPGNVKITVKREPRTPNRLTVEWSNLSGAVEKDWVGLFKKEDPSDASHMREWLFLGSCSRTSAGKVPASSGKCDMNMRSRLPVGSFEIRLMTDNSYNVIATSNVIRIFTASP